MPLSRLGLVVLVVSFPGVVPATPDGKVRFANVPAGAARQATDQDQPNWVGKTVLTNKPKLRLLASSSGKKEVDVDALPVEDFRVLADRDGRIKVRHHVSDGWLDKNDAVPLEQAVNYFTDRIQMNPKDAVAFIGRGIAWDLRDKLDDAIRDFDEAVRLAPKERSAFNNRGIAWAKKGDLDKAIRDFDVALRLDPRYAAGFNNRGICWKDKKDFAKAVRDFGQAMLHNPKDPRAYENKAWLLATCSDPKHRDGKQAVELARKARELSGWENMFHLELLAAAYAEAGQFAEAIRWQQKALENPDYARTQGEQARQRIELYRMKKPYREE